ncbi:MAG TPA: hypothetical protein PKX15_04530 [Bacteroidales bacterium]|nr:hypothetical protein [Bacteroidales bacterium]
MKTTKKKINESKLYNLLYKNFVSTEGNSISGILHKDVHLYASNGHIITRIKYDYPKEKEGLSIDKNNNVIEKPAKYENVMTPKNLYGEIMDIGMAEELKEAAKNIYKIRRKNFEPVINTGLTPIFDDGYDKIIAYRAVYIKVAIDLFEIIKENYILLFREGNEIYQKRLIFKSLENDTVVEIMGVDMNVYEADYADNVFTIRKAIKFNKIEKITAESN